MARCVESVHDGGRSVSFHQCLNSAKVSRGGKAYCTIHDPERVAKNRTARDAKFDAEWKAKQLGWAIVDARTRVSKAAEKWVDTGDEAPLRKAVAKLRRLTARAVDVDKT